MSAQPVDIQIFGRSLRVNCPPEQQDALNTAAADLEQRLHDLKNRTKVNKTECLALTAALNLCHELAQQTKKMREENIKKAEFLNKMEQRIRLLQQVIEQALPNQNCISESLEQAT
ncbi:cell division protein ZapA [Candidatus Regiella insecticola]|nr:cell division protein ZapA [Candidatus Regiella insecticola]